MSDNELRDRIAKAIDRGFNNGADLNDYEAETQAMAQAVIDDLGLTAEAVERMAEAIYRSHDSSTHFTAKPWDEMVKSKDRANKFRVKQDRKAARAAIDAVLGED